MSESIAKRGGWAGPFRLFLVVSAAIWLVAGLGMFYFAHTGLGSEERFTLTSVLPWASDFYLFDKAFHHFGTAEFFKPYFGFPFDYPATAALVFEFFYRVHPAGPLRLFIRVMFAVPVVAALWFAVALVRRGMGKGWALGFTLLTLLLSYPFQFEWERGNIEIILWAVGVFAVAAWWRRMYWIAAVLIGILSAAKIYPFILIGLLVGRRRYKQAAAAVAVAISMNTASLFLLGPTYSVANQGIKDGLAFFQKYYVFGLQSYANDHSLLALIKCLLYEPGDPGHRYSVLAPIYMATMATCGLVLYFVRIFRLPRINQLVSLVVISVLIPPVSYDYTLMHVYIAWAAMVLYVMETGACGKPVRWMFALFAFVLSPEGTIHFMDFSIGAQLKCIALIAILVLALRYRFVDEGDRASMLAVPELAAS